MLRLTLLFALASISAADELTDQRAVVVGNVYLPGDPRPSSVLADVPNGELVVAIESCAPRRCRFLADVGPARLVLEGDPEDLRNVALAGSRLVPPGAAGDVGLDLLAGAPLFYDGSPTTFYEQDDVGAQGTLIGSVGKFFRVSAPPLPLAVDRVVAAGTPVLAAPGGALFGTLKHATPVAVRASARGFALVEADTSGGRLLGWVGEASLARRAPEPAPRPLELPRTARTTYAAAGGKLRLAPGGEVVGFLLEDVAIPRDDTDAEWKHVVIGGVTFVTDAPSRSVQIGDLPEAAIGGLMRRP